MGNQTQQACSAPSASPSSSWPSSPSPNPPPLLPPQATPRAAVVAASPTPRLCRLLPSASHTPITPAPSNNSSRNPTVFPSASTPARAVGLVAARSPRLLPPHAALQLSPSLRLSRLRQRQLPGPTRKRSQQPSSPVTSAP